jgi:hypothetical protein
MYHPMEATSFDVPGLEDMPLEDIPFLCGYAAYGTYHLYPYPFLIEKKNNHPIYIYMLILFGVISFKHSHFHPSYMT